MPYAIYLRKSRKDIEAEARGEGETLERHRHTLLELAKRKGLAITEVYSEIVSGDSIAKRPQMQRLLADVEDGLYEGVLVMEVERLARGDTIDQGVVAQTFKFSNTKIITPLKVYDPSNEFDEEYFEFGLFMSRREYKTINRRMQAGRKAAAAEGKFCGSLAPYGYRSVKLSNASGFSLEPAPGEADVIKDVFTWYTEGFPQPDGTHKRLGISLIARELNQRGIPARKGGVWTTASLRDIIKNPVYAGKIRWNHSVAHKRRDGSVQRRDNDDCVLVDGLHEPLVEAAVWSRAQMIITLNRPAPIPNREELKSSLAGLIECGKCGRKMVRRPYNKKGQEPSLICSCNACNNVSSPLSLVESRLIEIIKDWAVQYEISLKRDEPLHRVPPNTDSIDNELAELEKQRSRLYDLLERGTYDDKTFLERSKVIAERIAKLTDERANIERIIKVEKEREEVRLGLLPRVENVVSTYFDSDDPAVRNGLLKMIMNKAVYTREPENRWQTERKFELELFMKLPE